MRRSALTLLLLLVAVQAGVSCGCGKLDSCCFFSSVAAATLVGRRLLLLLLPLLLPVFGVLATRQMHVRGWEFHTIELHLSRIVVGVGWLQVWEVSQSVSETVDF